MYVTDSLFYLQHLVGGSDNDENRKLYTARFLDILEAQNHQKPQETAEMIREKMIAKSQLLTGA